MLIFTAVCTQVVFSDGITAKSGLMVPFFRQARNIQGNFQPWVEVADTLTVPATFSITLVARAPAVLRACSRDRRQAASS